MDKDALTIGGVTMFIHLVGYLVESGVLHQDEVNAIASKVATALRSKPGSTNLNDEAAQFVETAFIQ